MTIIKTHPSVMFVPYYPTESTAVRNKAFVRDTKEKIGIKAMGGKVIGANGSYELRESETPYEADFGLENEDLRQENTFYLNVSV
jgi:hypothetical protein